VNVTAHVYVAWKLRVMEFLEHGVYTVMHHITTFQLLFGQTDRIYDNGPVKL
jgi:hypothetical protein